MNGASQMSDDHHGEPGIPFTSKGTFAWRRSSVRVDAYSGG